MRCLSCGNFTFFTFCKTCKRVLSEFSPRKRELDGFCVYSFYNYSDIKHLLFSKHHLHGLFVYKALASLSFTKFAKAQNFGTKIKALPLDDNPKGGYSHSAILAKSLKTAQISPIFNAMRAQNSVTYSGKSLNFRKNNKRNFTILKSIKAPVILVDDIITSGLTMEEAFKVCRKNGVEVLFGLVLADARE